MSDILGYTNLYALLNYCIYTNNSYMSVAVLFRYSFVIKSFIELPSIVQRACLTVAQWCIWYILTLRSPIKTAADDVHKCFCIVFQRQ